MEAAFLAEAATEVLLWRVTTEEAAGFELLEGGELPRIESYCQHVLARGEPWVVPDAAADPTASRLAITSAGRFGAYIGVPVTYPGGDPFGTLCCVSHEPRPDLGAREVAVLEALADVLGFHVGQLETSAERRRQLEARGGELAGRVRQQELRLGLLSQMVRAGRAPTIVLDPGTLRVDYVNDAAAALFGRDVDDVVGHTLWSRSPHWDESSLRAHLAPVLTGDAPVARLVVDDVTDDGRVYDVVVQRMQVADGTALLATGHDVTEQQRAEARLREALELERAAGERLRGLDTMRNAFLTAVSHELRTPLTSLRLAAETLGDDRVGDELRGLLLERLTANADRLDRLLGDLLDLNQFAHGQLRVDRSRVRLDELVREAVTQVELGDHRLELELEPVEAVVAPTKVERIAVNLVLNATVHTRPCTITVRLTRTNGDALLIVEDEGSGVAEDQREDLFQPFRQGGTVPSHRPGTGIGLSLVAAFAELHGGHAWIDETPEGGAAFHVALPVEPDD